LNENEKKITHLNNEYEFLITQAQKKIDQLNSSLKTALEATNQNKSLKSNFEKLENANSVFKSSLDSEKKKTNELQLSIKKNEANFQLQLKASQDRIDQLNSSLKTALEATNQNKSLKSNFEKLENANSVFKSSLDSEKKKTNELQLSIKKNEANFQLQLKASQDRIDLLNSSLKASEKKDSSFSPVLLISSKSMKSKTNKVKSNHKVRICPVIGCNGSGNSRIKTSQTHRSINSCPNRKNLKNKKLDKLPIFSDKDSVEVNNLKNKINALEKTIKNNDENKIALSNMDHFKLVKFLIIFFFFHFIQILIL
jgi:hypothetical protein